MMLFLDFWRELNRHLGYAGLEAFHGDARYLYERARKQGCTASYWRAAPARAAREYARWVRDCPSCEPELDAGR